MPMAYSYIRFSTPEQLKGDSLRRQKVSSEQYAKDHNLTLDNTLDLCDLGLSAYTGEHRDRGALGEFLKLVETGKIEKGSYLLVESLDRLSREKIPEAMQQFLNIINAGIVIVTVADSREYAKETLDGLQLMVSLTIMARAYEESLAKSRRLGAAWEEKRKNVGDGTKKLTAKCPAWLKLNSEKTEFIIKPEIAEVIKRIFKMKLAGKGNYSIVKELNANAQWKPDKGGWRESYVQKILRFNAVIGEFQPHKLIGEGKKRRQPEGELITNYYPAIIDRNVFFQVQELFKNNIGKGGQTGSVNNLFTHLAKCGHCGGPMALVDKGKRGGKLLICDRARRGQDCCRISIRYDFVEEFVLKHIQGLQPEDILDDEENKSVIVALKQEYDGKKGELNYVKEKIENLTDSIATTTDKRVRETLEKRMSYEYDQQEELNRVISSLETKIDEAGRAHKDTQQVLKSMEKLSEILRTATGNKRIEIRFKLRNEIKKLIQNIYITTAYFPPYTEAELERDMQLEEMYYEKGTVEYAQREAFFRHRMERPKDFRYISIDYKCGGSDFIPEENYDEWIQRRLKHKYRP